MHLVRVFTDNGNEHAVCVCSLNSDHCILTVTKHRQFMKPFVTVDVCQKRRMISMSSIYTTSVTKYPLLSMTVQADRNCYLQSNLPTAVGSSSEVLQHSLATDS